MYTINEIRSKVEPIAKKYDLKALYLFGSYARGEATENSDIDLLYDREGSQITSLITASEMYIDLKEALNTSIDLVSIVALYNKYNQTKHNIQFLERIQKDMVTVYER